MRMRSYLAAVATSVLAIVLTIATPAAAATPVLTVDSVGGPPVNVGDMLTASLKSGGTSNFYSSTTGTSGIRCTSAGFSATVITNPPAPGEAVSSLDSLSFGSCTSNVMGVTSVKSIGVGGLPYTIGINSSFRVLVSGSVGPIQVTVVLGTLLGDITCVYRPYGGTLTGTFSNIDSSITFTNQRFDKYSGPGTCYTPAYFSAVFAPVTDTSQGGARVFVN